MFFRKKSKQKLTEAEQRTRELLSDTDVALYDQPPRRSVSVLYACTALAMAFLGWAYLAQLDEVTRGDGQVIPSSKKQVVQSLEGGIVEELLTREGARVKKGQVLLRIDDTSFSSDLGEREAKAISLRAQLTRLQFEISNPSGGELVFQERLVKRAPMVVQNERSLYEIRKSNLLAKERVLGERLTQRRMELAELDENRKRFERSLEIAMEEQKLKKPMARQGIVPKTEVLQLDRVIADLSGQLAGNGKAIPRIEAAIREAERLIEEQRLTFRQEAQMEYNEKRADLSMIDQTMLAAKDRVVRTDIRSPVAGIVNTLHINTIGGVVRNGEPLVEITPVGDTLLVQAKIRPQDIAFIHPGQEALVKITAYDFTIYGGLDGLVEIISSDSIYDEATKETYYLVTIRTKEVALKKGDEVLPIIPGMVASVDIMTGKKTVLEYLLKPITKARHEALTER